MIKRALHETIEARILGKDKRAIILFGARQVGKTTLLEEILGGRDKVLWLNADEPDVREVFRGATSSRLAAYFAGSEIVVIDEAQRIEDVGLKLKLVTDSVKGVKLIATGSSSFDLSNKIAESLAGRKWEYQLYPLSFRELAGSHGVLEEKRLLAHRLVFGAYPEVATSPGSEKDILDELASSALYKDILQLDNIRNPDKLQRLLRALALQAGSEVSYNEVGQTCGLDVKTVERYVDVLEKAYIVFRLGSFSRNLRNELKKSRKVFFYDNGLRNALVSDYRPAELRGDVGALWENYMASELAKSLRYKQGHARCWFWRTTSQQEVDFVVEADGALVGYEFKWNPGAKAKRVKAFLAAYPEATVQVVNRDNYDDFL